MAYNLYWFSGTILQSGFSKTGDWTYAIQALNIGALAKPVLLVAGIISYLLSIKIIGVHVNNVGLVFPGFPLKKSVIYAYFAAAIAATIAGLFYKYDRTHAVLEGLLEMLGILPIVFIIPRRQTNVTEYKPGVNPIVAIPVLLLFIAFCFTLGRGISW